MNKLGSNGSSVMVGRKVAVGGGVRVGNFGVTPGSNVADISVGPSVFSANGSRVAVDVGKRVTVGATVSVGPAVAGVRKDRSAGKAEHPVMMMASRIDNVFFMVPQKFYWDYCINCIRFDGIVFSFRFCSLANSPLHFGPGS